MKYMISENENLSSITLYVCIDVMSTSVSWIYKLKNTIFLIDICCFFCILKGRKDVAQIFNNLLRRQIGTRSPTVEHILLHKEILTALQAGYWCFYLYTNLLHIGSGVAMVNAKAIHPGAGTVWPKNKSLSEDK